MIRCCFFYPEGVGTTTFGGVQVEERSGYVGVPCLRWKIYTLNIFLIRLIEDIDELVEFFDWFICLLD